MHAGIFDNYDNVYSPFYNNRSNTTTSNYLSYASSESTRSINASESLYYANYTQRKDEKFIMQAIQEYGASQFQYVDESVKKDREMVLKVVDKKVDILEYVDESLKIDREFILECIKLKGKSFKYANNLLRVSRDFILDAVKLNGGVLEYLDQSLKQDREIVLEAVKQEAWAFHYIDGLLKEDREFLFQLVEQNGLVLACVNDSLKKDREFVIEAVKQNGDALVYADLSLQKDRNFLLEISKQKGWTIEYTYELLKKDLLERIKTGRTRLGYCDSFWRDDRDIVLLAIRVEGSGLELAGPFLRKDREVVLQAVQRNGNEIKYADPSFRKDKEIMREVLKTDTRLLVYAHKSVRKESEIVSLLLNRGWSLLNADDSFKKDRGFVLELVKQNGSMLKYADPSLRKDEEIVLEAIKQSGNALEYADILLRKDRELVLKAVKRNQNEIIFADPSLLNDREIVLEAIKQRGVLLEYADESLKRDREIVLQAIKQEVKALLHADESLRRDKAFMKECIQLNRKSLLYANESLRNDREFILEIVKKNGKVLECVNESFMKDREIAIAAIRNNFESYVHVHKNLHTDFEFVYLISRFNTSLAKHFNDYLYAIIEKGSLYERLSKNILAFYTRNYGDENDLFRLVIQKKFPKASTPFFKFNAKYSSEFVEKLIIIETLKKISSIHKFTTVDSIPLYGNIDFHIFCCKLDLLLQENESKLQNPIPYSNVQAIVEDILFMFEIPPYSEKEIGSIFHFYNEWTMDRQHFDDYKQIIKGYIKLSGDYAKIIQVFKEFYYHLRSSTTVISDKYEIMSVLGHGGEGVAFKAFSPKLNQFVALKIKYEKVDEKESQERITFIRRDDIEGKIKCYECNLIENYMYSVMELGEETLADFIERNTNVYRMKSLNREYLLEVLVIFNKILCAVQTIHDNNISHRDLDPKNVVKVKDHYKIIDFDIAKVIKTGNSITLTLGKFSYMSPEVSHDNYCEELLTDDCHLAQNIGNITTSCDVFSLGCILLKLLTNCVLKLDREVLRNYSTLQKYGANYPYFTDTGVYFYSVLTDLLREKILHYAIQKTIDQGIDTNFGLNNILTKILITMIQKDSSRRLSCFTHKTILSKVIQYLEGSSNITLSEIEKEMEENYNEIISLKEAPQLIEENEELRRGNKELLRRINELEEENRKLKSMLQ